MGSKSKLVFMFKVMMTVTHIVTAHGKDAQGRWIENEAICIHIKSGTMKIIEQGIGDETDVGLCMTHR